MRTDNNPKNPTTGSQSCGLNQLARKSAETTDFISERMWKVAKVWRCEECSFCCKAPQSQSTWVQERFSKRESQRAALSALKSLLMSCWPGRKRFILILPSHSVCSVCVWLTGWSMLTVLAIALRFIFPFPLPNKINFLGVLNHTSYSSSVDVVFWSGQLKPTKSNLPLKFHQKPSRWAFC